MFVVHLLYYLTLKIIRIGNPTMYENFIFLLCRSFVIDAMIPLFVALIFSRKKRYKKTLFFYYIFKKKILHITWLQHSPFSFIPYKYSFNCTQKSSTNLSNSLSCWKKMFHGVNIITLAWIKEIFFFTGSITILYMDGFLLDFDHHRIELLL